MVSKKIFKNKTYLLFTVLLYFCVFFTQAGMAESKNIKSRHFIKGSKWELSFDDFKKMLPKQTRHIIFKPEEKPGYSNKIINFIKAIAPKQSAKIIIIRIGTNPGVDYLFINKRLYSAMLDWGIVSAESAGTIISRLASEYKVQSVEKGEQESTYSFKNNKTDIILYTTRVSDSTLKCIIYFYTKKMFKKLILE